MLISLLFLSSAFAEVAVGPFGSWQTGEDGGYECELYHNADGVGPVYELNYGECQRKFEKTGDSFIFHDDFYRNRDHCQKTVFTNKRYDHGWEICSPKGTVQNHFDWDDQKGWCVGEDKRKELGRAGSRAACLTKCERETWNGKYPRGCEWSRNYGTCNVFFGKGMWSTNKGSSYRCNVNVKEGVSFTAEESAVGQYSYSQQEKNCFNSGGVWAGSWCDYHSSHEAEEEAVGQYACSHKSTCPDNCFIGGRGRCCCLDWSMVDSEDEESEKAVAFPDTMCIMSGGRWTGSRCIHAESSLANHVVSSSSGTTTAVNIFAAIGLSFVAYGAFRHYTK